jgi:anthranilate synthase component 1
VRLSIAAVHSLPVEPSLDSFLALSKLGNVIPVYTQLAADFETPLSAYLKIRDGAHAFLLESAESTEKGGRWSIVGSKPKCTFSAQDKNITITRDSTVTQITAKDDVLAELERQMAPYRPVPHGAIPPFYGGILGYLSYDAVRQFEPSIGPAPHDDLQIPDAFFMLADTLLVFDHRLRRLLVIANAFTEESDTAEDAYAHAKARVAAMVEILNRPLHTAALNGLTPPLSAVASSNTTQETFEENVRKGKEYIAAGDVFQFVPSQRFEAPYTGAPVDLYRALRHVNPSPYMFLLELGNFSLVGSSPEVHVKSIDGRIDIRPIAGTRWRGKRKKKMMR